MSHVNAPCSRDRAGTPTISIFCASQDPIDSENMKELHHLATSKVYSKAQSVVIRIFPF